MSRAATRDPSLQEVNQGYLQEAERRLAHLAVVRQELEGALLDPRYDSEKDQGRIWDSLNSLPDVERTLAQEIEIRRYLGQSILDARARSPGVTLSEHDLAKDPRVAWNTRRLTEFRQRHGRHYPKDKNGKASKVAEPCYHCYFGTLAYRLQHRYRWSPQFYARLRQNLTQRRNGGPALEIDIDKLVRQEGSWRDGYVDVNPDGTVQGSSGVAVATGFDIGKHSKDELHALAERYGWPPGLAEKLEPYAEKDGDEASEVLVALGPLTLTEEEALAVDEAVVDDYTSKTEAAWNRAAPIEFADLDADRQTVLFLMSYNRGAAHSSWDDDHRAFYDAAASGRWPDAERILDSIPGDKGYAAMLKRAREADEAAAAALAAAARATAAEVEAAARAVEAAALALLPSSKP
jgi:hypothetical protein